MTTAFLAAAFVLAGVGVLLLVECFIIDYLCHVSRNRRPWQQRLCDAVERWAKTCAEERRREQ